MADLYGSQDVTIRNDDGTKTVSISTDNSKERLDVCSASSSHQKIIDQQRFFCWRYASGLANGVNYDLAVVTHATIKANMIFAIRWIATGRVEIYEGATLSNNGTALTTYNRDRNSATVGSTLFYHTPTVTATGTLILGSIHPVGTDALSLMSDYDHHLILKANTKYLIRMASTSGSNSYTMLYDWYEV
jgi:hypothetical protein